MISLRSFCRKDRAVVFHLLAGLPLLYPNSNIWLDKRLYDVTIGKAKCTLAQVGATPVGLTIETPKSQRNLKLCTIFVDPRFRSMQIGTLLLGNCLRNWILDEMSGVHVTVDSRRSRQLVPFFSRFGFEPVCTEYNRYGTDRDEHILVWKHSNLLIDTPTSNGLFRDSSRAC